jgi:hypothetical protein
LTVWRSRPANKQFGVSSWLSASGVFILSSVDKIDHIHPRNRQHFTKCKKCAAWFDTRDMNKERHHDLGMCRAELPGRQPFPEQVSAMSLEEYARWLKAQRKQA